MSPEIIGILLGIIFVAPTVYFVRHRGYGNWAWPVFLVSLPIWYMLFGVLAMDTGVIFNELIFGLPYIVSGLLLLRYRNAAMQLLLALAWLSHGFYDYYHDLFFINPGVFSFYPAFCAVVDIGVGGYLLVNLFLMRETAAGPD